MLFFYSEECEHCKHVEEFILESLKGTYPIRVEKISVDETEGYKRLLKMEEASGDTGNDIPAIFIGNRGLGGIDEIESEIEYVLTEFLKGGYQGAKPSKHQEDKAEGITSKEISPHSEQTPLPLHSASKDANQPSPLKQTLNRPAQVPVYAAYFSKQGCKECDRAFKDLRYLQSKHPNFILRVYDISDPNSKTLNEALGLIFKVPGKKRLTAPSFFTGKDYLLESEIRVNRLEDLILKYTHEPAPPPWETAEGLEKKAEENIISRFHGISLSTIIAAGLLDGINPCAFATIIFFISYLTYIGRKGKEILFVGGAFTLAVFITYMLIGLGFLSFIKGISFLPLFSKIVYLATAVFALILGILSLRDFFVCRSGKTSDMSLQLPNFLKKRIHKTIREEARLKRYILGAMITGFIISILELACTGQVYLPTIIFVTRVSKLRIQSILYLILYNLMFISPLFVIFITVYKGTTSQQLTALFQRSSAFIKLGIAVLFFTLAVILLVSMV